MHHCEENPLYSLSISERILRNCSAKKQAIENRNAIEET